MTDSNATEKLRVLVKPNLYCPPCMHFKPELVSWSFRATDAECDRSDYIIDCEHREVCVDRNGG